MSTAAASTSKYSNRFYVYAHLRKDTGTIFYVGRGTAQRIYQKARRGDHWQSIVRKHGLKTMFIRKHLNLLEANYLESYYIKIYGRKSNGGILINQTDGADGQTGAIITEAKKELMRRIITGRVLKPVDKDKLISDYLACNSLKQAAALNGICIGTAMKYIPKDLRQESRSANGRLNSERLKRYYGRQRN